MRCSGPARSPASRRRSSSRPFGRRRVRFTAHAAESGTWSRPRAARFRVRRRARRATSTGATTATTTRLAATAPSRPPGRGRRRALARRAGHRRQARIARAGRGRAVRGRRRAAQPRSPPSPSRPARTPRRTSRSSARAPRALTCGTSSASSRTTTQAALLAGLVAGFVAADQGGTSARVAWVGPEERPLVRAFARGVHRALPRAVVLDAAVPLDSGGVQGGRARGDRTGRGRRRRARRALRRGRASRARTTRICRGCRLGEFEFPNVVANAAVREAVAGIFRGGEDIVFGLASGAVGIGTLDPRISSATLVRARSSIPAG